MRAVTRRPALVWLATVLFVAAPAAARLCETVCAARASHCHPVPTPKGCPEHSHRADTTSLTAAKAATVEAVRELDRSAASPALGAAAAASRWLAPGLRMSPAARSAPSSVLRL